MRGKGESQPIALTAGTMGRNFNMLLVNFCLTIFVLLFTKTLMKENNFSE
jgi:hypothetical protein